MGGNKRRKLRDVLTRENLANKQRVVTAGGAFSNHLIAVAEACRHFGIPAMGFVRGEPVENPVLQACEERGMSLRFLSRSEFRDALDSPPLEDGDYWIPLGGSVPGRLGGVTAILLELKDQLPDGWTHLAVSAGTGGTAAGLAPGMNSTQTLDVYPAIKGVQPDTWWAGICQHFQITAQARVRVFSRAAGKGFARQDPSLEAFIARCDQDWGIPWDPIYTGKMAKQFLHELESGHYPPGSRVILLHTGGWAGGIGYQWRYQQQPADT